MSKRDRCVRVLGNLKPNKDLLATVLAEQTNLNNFLGQADLPKELAAFAISRGFAATESAGMLFASNAGVGLHNDHEPALLWILCGTDHSTMHGRSHVLLVGDEEVEQVELHDGMVLWFDSTIRHGVIAMNTSLWACYSIYCEKVK